MWHALPVLPRVREAVEMSVTGCLKIVSVERVQDWPYVSITVESADGFCEEHNIHVADIALMGEAAGLCRPRTTRTQIIPQYNFCPH